MARRGADARREEILAETVTQVLQRGFEGVRVADVAEALGISQALVFYHFTTKERLLADALELAVQRDLDRLDSALAGGADAVDRLRRLLEQYAPRGSARGWTIWVDAWSGALRAPELRARVGRLDAHWRAALVGVLEEGVAAGAFTCPEPDASARRVLALADGLAVQVTVHRRLGHRQLADWLRRAAEAEVGLAAGALDGAPVRPARPPPPPPARAPAS